MSNQVIFLWYLCLLTPVEMENNPSASPSQKFLHLNAIVIFWLLHLQAKTPWLLLSFFIASQLLKMLLLLLYFKITFSFSTSPFMLTRKKLYRVGDHREFPWIGPRDLLRYSNNEQLWSAYYTRLALVVKILLWINYYYPYFTCMQSSLLLLLLSHIKS